VEEMPEDPNAAGEYYYEEPDLSGGVEGVDYYIAYGEETRADDPGQKTRVVSRVSATNHGSRDKLNKRL